VSDNVHPIVEPDAQQMLRHVQHLFGGELDGCHEGKIELAWTDGRDGRLRHADLFGTDQLEDLVERAARENRIPGQNVYVGQALRKPDIAPFGRCSDDDFFALTAFYADLDDDVIATARISYRHRGCPPTGVVVTGRHPHVRAQMLWRLDTPERDPEICRRQNRALANALGGDPSVVNPGRVMRLGGSVAWPVKPDRIVERTEFLTFDDGRPRVYLPGQLARAFPPAPPESPDLDTRRDSVSRLNIGSEFDGITVDACLAAIRAGDHWHDNLVRLTGHWIARGWSDTEILTAAEALTLPGCIEHIRAHGIGAFIVDLFVETHEVTENSNEQIKAVAVMFREIARAGNCAVMLVHHTAKPPQGSSDGHAGNLNTSRGASALAGVARIVQTLFSMSARDAEQHGVDDDERHLFVRLDDAKANLGLISGRARWFRRVGVTIANGDEVGVLVPEDLQPVADGGADPTRDDFHRTIVAALLAQVPEDGITVNSAAKLLAWGPHEAFHRYRQTDDRGHQRVSRTLRDAIVAACRACTAIVDGPCSRGFACDEQASPKCLRRFEHPFTPTTQGLDRPEFEKDQPW
jgi:AAA domain